MYSLWTKEALIQLGDATWIPADGRRKKRSQSWNVWSSVLLGFNFQILIDNWYSNFSVGFSSPFWCYLRSYRFISRGFFEVLIPRVRTLKRMELSWVSAFSIFQFLLCFVLLGRSWKNKVEVGKKCPRGALSSCTPFTRICYPNETWDHRIIKVGWDLGRSSHSMPAR